MIGVFFLGFLFAAGLAVSGLTDPDKVRAFLDVTGNWDPSLLWTMLGAIAVYAVGYRWLCTHSAQTPKTEFRRYSRFALVVGSILFGVGWGLAGACPGPGLVNLGFLRAEAIGFVAAMCFGMFIYGFFISNAKPRRNLDEQKT